MVCAKQGAASETEPTLIVLVGLKIVCPYKIIEGFILKPVSHPTMHNGIRPQPALIYPYRRSYKISLYLNFISLEILFLYDRDIKRH